MCSSDLFLTKELRLYSGKISARDLVGVPLGVTDANGYFKVVPEPGQTYGWLWAYHPCYLTGQKQLPQPGNQGTLTLTDANYTMSYVPATFTVLVPTVIDEMTNTTLLLGTPDTGDAQSTSTAEEEKQKSVEVVAAADTSASTDTTAQPLPVCQ